MKLVTVILFVCLSLTEIRSKEKGDKNNLPDKTDSPKYCKNEIVFFLSVLRLCTTYRRILYSKSRVKNWAGLDKNIQAALHIADSNIPGGKPGSRKDGSKDSSGNNGSKQQSDSDNGPEKLSYEDTDFGTDGYIGFFYNEEKSGDSDEDGKENLDDDESMDEESSPPPELSASVIRALQRHLEQSDRHRQEQSNIRRCREEEASPLPVSPAGVHVQVSQPQAPLEAVQLRNLEAIV